MQCPQTKTQKTFNSTRTMSNINVNMSSFVRTNPSLLLLVNPPYGYLPPTGLQRPSNVGLIQPDSPPQSSGNKKNLEVRESTGSKKRRLNTEEVPKINEAKRARVEAQIARESDSESGSIVSLGDAQSNNDKDIPIPPSPSPGTIIVDLEDNDVLLGRGSGVNDHIGNIKFRNLISLYRERYLATSNRAKKRHIAVEILDDVRRKEPPGRFLERVVAGKITERNKQLWIVVTEDKTLEKIKQALRQLSNRNHMPKCKTGNMTPSLISTTMNLDQDRDKDQSAVNSRVSKEAHQTPSNPVPMLPFPNHVLWSNRRNHNVITNLSRIHHNPIATNNYAGNNHMAPYNHLRFSVPSPSYTAFHLKRPFPSVNEIFRDLLFSAKRTNSTIS